MIEDFEYIERADNIQAGVEQTTSAERLDLTVTKEFCDVCEFEDRTAWAVQNFLERDAYREPPYAEASVEQRAEYMREFHDNFNEMSGYSDNLHFSNGMRWNNLGAFSPGSKRIELNARLLNESNPRNLMETIMHESRHAYQDYAVNHPEKVSVDPRTIAIWDYNFKHYISAEYDYEAYYHQPVEADANDFANRMYEQGAQYAP